MFYCWDMENIQYFFTFVYNKISYLWKTTYVISDDRESTFSSTCEYPHLGCVCQMFGFGLKSLLWHAWYMKGNQCQIAQTGCAVICFKSFRFLFFTLSPLLQCLYTLPHHSIILPSHFIWKGLQSRKHVYRWGRLYDQIHPTPAPQISKIKVSIWRFMSEFCILNTWDQGQNSE